jgi:hypothetical protein
MPPESGGGQVLGEADWIGNQAGDGPNGLDLIRRIWLAEGA